MFAHTRASGDDKLLQTHVHVQIFLQNRKLDRKDKEEKMDTLLFFSSNKKSIVISSFPAGDAVNAV